MKKIMCFIMLICFAFSNVSLSFAKDVKMPVEFYYPTVKEIENELSILNYSLNLNGNTVSDNILVRRYSPYVGDYVSLRQVITALGGNIEWKPNRETRELATFEIFNEKYVLKLADCIGWIDNIPEIYIYSFPIDLYMIMDGKEIPLTMGGMSSSMFTKFIDNTNYVSLCDLRKLLPRMGYLINADDKNFSINVKSYDFNKEKEIFLNTFPAEKFGKSWYSQEYDRYIYEKNLNFYLCADFYFNQYNCTEAVEDSYKVYIDNNYRQMYSYGNEKAYKDLLQAAYYTYTDDELKVKYNKDLDAYIVYNKEYDNVSKLDDTYKILVVRRYDNMIMFQYFS